MLLLLFKGRGGAPGPTPNPNEGRVITQRPRTNVVRLPLRRPVIKQEPRA